MKNQDYDKNMAKLLLIANFLLHLTFTVPFFMFGVMVLDPRKPGAHALVARSVSGFTFMSIAYGVFVMANFFNLIYSRCFCHVSLSD